jgi:hypothetical protein
MQNNQGQGVSHAKDSQLPQKAQEKVHLPFPQFLSYFPSFIPFPTPPAILTRC